MFGREFGFFSKADMLTYKAIEPDLILSKQSFCEWSLKGPWKASLASFSPVNFIKRHWLSSLAIEIKNDYVQKIKSFIQV